MSQSLFTPEPPPLTPLRLDSPVGVWALHATETHLLSLTYHGDNPKALWRAESSLRTEPHTQMEKRLASMLSRYFNGQPVDFGAVRVALPTASQFMAVVLETLRSIPYGETRHYGWLAAQLAKPGAARAVGGVLGRNPLPVILPCHRILPKDNTLGGFMRAHPDGPRVKAFLLGLEGVVWKAGR